MMGVRWSMVKGRGLGMLGGCGGGNEFGISLVELAFPIFIREVILLIFKELNFLEKMVSKIF